MPRFVRLNDETLRGRLADLRAAATKVLEGNYLPSFTDHTVKHSDQLCELVDQLTAPLAATDQLRDTESFVLYASCYTHDAGLQHQRAGETQTIFTVLQQPAYVGRNWRDLDLATQRKIVRANHHRLSGEMIRQSIDAPQPTPLGIQLTQDWWPAQIASLSIAHCLDSRAEEYKQLTTDWGGFRMSLLSAILRLADILDESRRRSQLFLERTRELDLESRMHWWRHYYVADVQIDGDARTITLWFDLPPDRRTEYRELIVPLQVPWLEAELARHGEVLARNKLLWHFKTDEVPAIQSSSSRMSDDLERYVLQVVAKRREEQAQRDQLILLDQLKTVRPTIERDITTLRNAITMSADDQLKGFREVAEHLRTLGGHRDGWILLGREYERLKASCGLEVRIGVATDLAAMLLQDGGVRRAAILLHELREQAAMLPDSAFLKCTFFFLLGRAYFGQDAYPEAVAALEEALRLAPNDEKRTAIRAELAELRLLRGLFVGPDTAGAGED
jgi:hypothetical protein